MFGFYLQRYHSGGYIFFILPLRPLCIYCFLMSSLVDRRVGDICLYCFPGLYFMATQKNLIPPPLENFKILPFFVVIRAYIILGTKRRIFSLFFTPYIPLFYPFPPHF